MDPSATPTPPGPPLRAGDSAGQPRWALLAHTTPDALWHCDWLLERPDVTVEHRLLTFRLAAPPSWEAGARFQGMPAPEHRAVYLDFEGELSGGRGRVRRLAGGRLLSLRVDGSSLETELRLGISAVSIRGVRQASSAWTFDVVGSAVCG